MPNFGSRFSSEQGRSHGMTRNRVFIITNSWQTERFSLDCLTLLNVLVPLTGRGAGIKRA